MWSNGIGYEEFQNLNENHLKRQKHSAREINAILMHQTVRSELMKENISDNNNVRSAAKVADTLRTSKKLHSPHTQASAVSSPSVTPSYAREYHLNHLDEEMKYKASKNKQHREAKLSKEKKKTPAKDVELPLIIHRCMKNGKGTKFEVTYPGETEPKTIAKSKIANQYKQQIAQWEFHNPDKIEWQGSSQNLDNMFPHLTNPTEDHLLQDLTALELDELSDMDDEELAALLDDEWLPEDEEDEKSLVMRKRKGTTTDALVKRQKEDSDREVLEPVPGVSS
eukprot:CAMPEP_0168542380 /NCGR_PEP_ID=MMETSP0413-20121227/1317_1 /TAXON_ID=136452 /ORGANISM="Filamoeba nolandi, Strain NC-AS-23-1" /LENGTH=280 /DNA_ID=CAMNT_0008572253 /DNA_START=244 /DNA_END=1083 /DNA_ORIENTATION=-